MFPLSRRALGLAVLAGPALAQGPRPLTIIVAYPAGGDTDALARIYAEKLAPRLGRPVVVENRSGASGAVGSIHVARAAADGDTLLMAPSTFAIVPHVLRRGANYDPVADFTPIHMPGTTPLLLVASRQSGLRSLADVVAAAKAGRITGYGSPGTGSPMTFMGEMFNRAAGLQVQEIAYRGVAPIVNDLLAGTIAIGNVTPGAVAPHLAAGTIIPVAVTERARSPVLPEVPTFIEAGFEVDVQAWWGLYGPRGLPEPFVAQVNAQMEEVIRLPEVQERHRAFGIVTTGGAPAVLAARTRADWDRFGRLARELAIQAD